MLTLLPFVFLRRRVTRAPIPTLQLVYARDTESFVRCAGPLRLAARCRWMGPSNGWISPTEEAGAAIMRSQWLGHIATGLKLVNAASPS